MNSQPPLLIHEDGNAEDASTVVGCNTSDSNEVVARSVDSKQPDVGPGDAVKEVCKETNNKDKVVKLLREEIDALKSKIVELEAKCSDRGHSPGLHQVGSPLGVFLALRNIRIGIGNGR
ncbi:hypothetical protein C1H46_033953 [Malus baccata]|uniref:Uncharacterized protein n=1 Tax=Malus baccata TaxID=106549 RepID=A0A540L208_MALBA|nr:hypothetical protein C1H46_033953 [Malus baccata]